MGLADTLAQVLGAGANWVSEQQNQDRLRRQLALQEFQNNRQAEQQEFDQITKGIMPGATIAPETAQRALKYGLQSLMAKGPDGVLRWAKSPDDLYAESRAITEQQQGRLAAMRADLEARELQMRQQLESDPTALLEYEYPERAIRGQLAGLRSVPFRNTEEMRQFNPSAANALLNSQRPRSGGGMNPVTFEKGLEQLALNQMDDPPFNVGGALRFNSPEQRQRFEEIKNMLRQRLQGRMGTTSIFQDEEEEPEMMPVTGFRLIK